MQNVLDLAGRQWRSGLEIVILAIAVFLFFRHFRAERPVRIFGTIFLSLLAIMVGAQVLELVVIGWLVKCIAFFLAVILVVVYQPELRRAIGEISTSGLLFFKDKQRKEFLDDFSEALKQLAARRFGALFAIERAIVLKSHLETGVKIDARFSTELILTIFHPKTPLHDGGMILRDGKIVGAACVFPVSQKELTDRSIGLRHRAGIGITEESDAIAIVVSEETGGLSLCHDGLLERNLEPEDFARRLADLLASGPGDEETEEESTSGSKTTIIKPKSAADDGKSNLGGAVAE